MTFNDDAKLGSSKVSRRGRTGAIAGGGGIVGVIAVFLIAQFTGVDLSGLLGGGGGTASDSPLTECKTGQDANSNVDCLIQGASDSLDSYWSTDAGVDGYVAPQVVLFDQQTTTGCGNATSAVGPFYCPPDQTIYIDTTFYAELRDRFGSSGGPLAEMYVIAHEWGHHIQNISGIMNGLDLQATGPTSDSVRLEVQADCFAGAWVGAASTIEDSSGTTFLEPVTDAQIADALSAASAVGDDHIQESTSGQVSPETWTHGSSDQRQKWFNTGLTAGPQACNTFDVATLD